MVRTLAGKHTGDLVTELDLHRAKETIRQYAIVGLTIEMEESIRRFNIIMGINTDKVNDDGARVRCINEFFGGHVNMSGMKKLNSNPHPVVSYIYVYLCYSHHDLCKTNAGVVLMEVF